MKIQRSHIQEQQMGTFPNGAIRCYGWTDLMAHCCQGGESYSLHSSSYSLFHDFGYLFLPWSSPGCIISWFIWLICQKSIWFGFGFCWVTEVNWSRQVRQWPDVAQGKKVHHSAGSDARGMQIEGRMTGKEKKRVRGTLDISETVERSNSVVTQ